MTARLCRSSLSVRSNISRRWCFIGVSRHVTSRRVVLHCLLFVIVVAQGVREVAQIMLCVPTSVGVLVRVARPVRDETVLPSDAIASASAAAAAAGLLNLSEIVARNLSPSPSAIAAARHAAAGTPAAAPSTSDAAPQPSRSGEPSAISASSASAAGGAKAVAAGGNHFFLPC